MNIDTAVHISISYRSNSKGQVWTEIKYMWEKDGRPRYALTRLPWLLNDHISNRVHERLAFIRRQNIPFGVQYQGGFS